MIVGRRHSSLMDRHSKASRGQLTGNCRQETVRQLGGPKTNKRETVAMVNGPAGVQGPLVYAPVLSSSLCHPCVPWALADTRGTRS